MQFKNIKNFSADGKSLAKFYHSGVVVWKSNNTGPGPSELIKGDLQAGFYGEIPASDFITGDELCRLAGITQGTSQFSNEPWLKFSYLKEIAFVSKKTIRYGISWDHINEKGCVFGEKIVTIKGQKYKVTLLKAKTEGKQNDLSTYEGTINHGSMWNKLLGQVHEKAPDKWSYEANMEKGLVNWGINYTDKDLHTFHEYGNGTWSWCQEAWNSNVPRMIRGYLGLSNSYARGGSNTGNGHGFRPALILINE